MYAGLSVFANREFKSHDVIIHYSGKLVAQAGAVANDRELSFDCIKTVIRSDTVKGAVFELKSLPAYRNMALRATKVEDGYGQYINSAIINNDANVRWGKTLHILTPTEASIEVICKKHIAVGEELLIYYGNVYVDSMTKQ
jgi:hypothetical protein